MLLAFWKIFSFNEILTFAFFLDFTRTISTEDEEFTSSIVDDHLPLIAGGAAILFAFIIAVVACCCIRKRKRKKKGVLENLYAILMRA